MPAYSVEISVINLSTSSIEIRKSAFVERKDWLSALAVALNGVIEELPSLDVVKKEAFRLRLQEIMAGAKADYGSGRDRGS